MIAYVDTSTLIKLLIDEVGTAEAAVIWDQPDTLVTVRIAHVEARAALSNLNLIAPESPAAYRKLSSDPIP